ncbi:MULTISPECIES: DinB family protein [unclassified Micromonospora]|uniref:DinB family protein n=1 Tax=unclassified Micromonospora TaxID=2617518 RepID=UPI002FF07B72
MVVDDVDVTAFVAAELDRRHPERLQVRAMRTADDYRAMWDALERLWSDTLARAEQLPEAVRHERADDEWSFAETLRHLIFAIDVWVGRMLLGEEKPYHRLGLPPTDYSRQDAAELGIDLEARAEAGCSPCSRPCRPGDTRCQGPILSNFQADASVRQAALNTPSIAQPHFLNSVSKWARSVS